MTRMRTTLAQWLRVFYEDGYEDWVAVRFQPILMLALLCSGLILVGADLLDEPPRFAQDRALGLVPGLWKAMLIGAPLFAFISASMVIHGQGRIRVWGLGLRVGADIAAAAALCSYVVSRLVVETYVTSACLLIATAVFAVAIVGRDIRAFRRRGQ